METKVRLLGYKGGWVELCNIGCGGGGVEFSAIGILDWCLIPSSGDEGSKTRICKKNFSNSIL